MRRQPRASFPVPLFPMPLATPHGLAGPCAGAAASATLTALQRWPTPSDLPTCHLFGCDRVFKGDSLHEAFAHPLQDLGPAGLLRSAAAMC